MVGVEEALVVGARSGPGSTWNGDVLVAETGKEKTAAEALRFFGGVVADAVINVFVACASPGPPVSASAAAAPEQDVRSVGGGEAAQMIGSLGVVVPIINCTRGLVQLFELPCSCAQQAVDIIFVGFTHAHLIDRGCAVVT